MTKKVHPSIEIATDTGSAVLGAATRAGGVAKRLLRRTRLLASHAPRKLPGVPLAEPAGAADGHITLILPEAPTRTEEMAHELTELRARTERAEHAAAWLRARLRAERSRQRSLPHLDVARLTTDLTHELARTYGAHPDVVGRIVQRTLAAHGLPIDRRAIERPSGGATLPEPLFWPRGQQEALAQQVVERAPEIADPAYVHRAVALLARRGRLTLPELMRAAGFESAMARRRLRLAVEAMTALGALIVHDGAYTLNAGYRPAPSGAASSRHARPPHGGRPGRPHF